MHNRIRHPLGMDGRTTMTDGTPAATTAEPPSVVLKMWPPAPRSVARARRFLACHLGAWGLAGITDSAELIVSELVTNALNHACPPYGHLIVTRFERLASGVRIEVHDANVAEPKRREAGADAESGRGLALVDALTGGRWGVSDRNGPGKIVWAVCGDDGTEPHPHTAAADAPDAPPVGWGGHAHPE